MNIQKCINFAGVRFKWLKFEKHVCKKLCPFSLLHTTGFADVCPSPMSGASGKKINRFRSF